MNQRPSDLPDFSNPPVVETVLSVQFDRLTAARSGHFGLYWQRVIDRFPRTEERPELQPAIEKQREPPPSRIGIQFEALEAPPIPRFWFTNEHGTELIQLQRDRFIKNWRKVGDGDQYPRYERIREAFGRDFIDFQDFVAEHELGSLRINQCEVSYINHIVAGKGWENHLEVDKVFTFWRQPTASIPGAADGLTFFTRFPISDNAGAFVGRLHVTMQSVARLADGLPMFVLDLTARGLVGNSLEFFDVGREWIVRSFKELTTPDMHRVWGLKN